MSINKVQFDGNTLIDLSSDTVEASKLLRGYTAHNSSGDIITGSYDPPTTDTSRVWKFTQATDSSEGATIPILNSDSWLAAHKSDTSLVMNICSLSTITETAKYVYMWTQTNYEIFTSSSSKYGRMITSQQSASTITQNGFSQPISSATSQGFIIDGSTGALSLVTKNAGAANLILPAGDYLITAAIDNN